MKTTKSLEAVRADERFRILTTSDKAFFAIVPKTQSTESTQALQDMSVNMNSVVVQLPSPKPGQSVAYVGSLSVPYRVDTLPSTRSIGLFPSAD